MLFRRVLNRRKPTLLSRLPGSFLLRFAARQFLASLIQLPPRITRFEPDTVIILVSGTTTILSHHHEEGKLISPKFSLRTMHFPQKRALRMLYVLA
jgi:hypothetical protein